MGIGRVRGGGAAMPAANASARKPTRAQAGPVHADLGAGRVAEHATTVKTCYPKRHKADPIAGTGPTRSSKALLKQCDGYPRSLHHRLREFSL